jgi:hypothetical protein
VFHTIRWSANEHGPDSRDNTAALEPIMANWLITMTVAAGLVITAWVLVYRLAPEHRQTQTLRWLASWTIKGLFVPWLLWTVMNFGISWQLQPFMPQIQAAQNRGGSWLPAYFNVLGAGTFVLGSYWTAVTLGWAIFAAAERLEAEARGNLRGLLIASALGMGLFAVPIIWLGGWSMAGLAASIMLAPVVGYAPGFIIPTKLPPMYARAIAKVKFGKYSEAEWEIIGQLEKSEDDFEGWMMLAELYAVRFNDVDEAEQTILEICDQPKLTPSQVAVALHKLAEWRLKFSNDPDGARRALQVICHRYPGSHLARMAALRADQIPATIEDLQAQVSAAPIPLPALGDNLDSEPGEETVGVSREEAGKLANSCVERLQRDPNHTPSREKFARLLAEQLGKVAEGIEQISLLMDMPGQPDASRARWLGQVAAWRIKYQRDFAAARNDLARIIREFPDTPEAFAARRRLEQLDRAQSQRHAAG